MDLLCFFSVLCLLCLCVRLFLCVLWSPAGKGLTSWLSFVVSQREFVTFSLVLLDFSLTVKAAPHEYVIRSSQP